MTHDILLKGFSAMHTVADVNIIFLVFSSVPGILDCFFIRF